MIYTDDRRRLIASMEPGLKALASPTTTTSPRNIRSTGSYQPSEETSHKGEGEGGIVLIHTATAEKRNVLKIDRGHCSSIRSNQNRWVQRSRSEDKNLIPWQQDLVIFNMVGVLKKFHRYQPKCDTDDTDERLQTRILKNQEGCVNTLSMECMDFYHRFHHYHYLWH